MHINLGRKILSTFCVMLMISMIFQTVAAAHTIYTIEDNNANITLNSGDTFNVSLSSGWVGWNYSLSNPSLLKIDYEYVMSHQVGGPGTCNWTFEGVEKGTTTLEFIRYESYMENGTIVVTNTIADSLFLNVTSNVRGATSQMLIIIIITVIIVISIALIIKWMKGEEKHEN